MRDQSDCTDNVACICAWRPKHRSADAGKLRLGVPEAESKIAVVTGAGRGIGQALARGFAVSGYRVAAADIDEPAARATAAQLRAAGSSALGLRVDVAEPESITRMIDAVIAEWVGWT